MFLKPVKLVSVTKHSCLRPPQLLPSTAALDCCPLLPPPPTPPLSSPPPPPFHPLFVGLPRALCGHAGRDDSGQVWLGCSGRAAAGDLQHCSTAGHREPTQTPQVCEPLPPPPPRPPLPSYAQPVCPARVLINIRCNLSTCPSRHSIHARSPSPTYKLVSVTNQPQFMLVNLLVAGMRPVFNTSHTWLYICS